MHTDDITASLGKVSYPLLWVHNHLQGNSFVAARDMHATLQGQQSCASRHVVGTDIAVQTKPTQE